jgi:hypothetical protein
MITEQHRIDANELTSIASSMNFNDFVDFVKTKCNWWDINGEFIDFEFKSLCGSIIIEQQVLIGSFDCFNEQDERVDSIITKDIYFS